MKRIGLPRIDKLSRSSLCTETGIVADACGATVMVLTAASRSGSVCEMIGSDTQRSLTSWGQSVTIEQISFRTRKRVRSALAFASVGFTTNSTWEGGKIRCTHSASFCEGVTPPASSPACIREHLIIISGCKDSYFALTRFLPHFHQRLSSTSSDGFQ